MDEEEEQQRRGLSPTRVFVVLLIVVALLVGIGLLATSNNDPVADDQPLPDTNNFALTDAQAIARFKELDALRIRAYTKRDVSLLDDYVTTTSPLRSEMFEDIEKLMQREVLFQPKLQNQQLSVEQNQPEEVVIRQVVRESTRFVSEEGQDVSRFSGPILLTVDWTMHLERDRWLIYDSFVLSSEKIDQN